MSYYNYSYKKREKKDGSKLISIRDIGGNALLEVEKKTATLNWLFIGEMRKQLDVNYSPLNTLTDRLKWELLGK